MITDKDLNEIKERIEKAKEPLYIFDDDQDGLCAFLLFWRKWKRGKGIPVKGQLREDIIPRLHRERKDLVVILDKPTITQEIVDAINVPIIHLDHHQPLDIRAPQYHYFNPRINDDADWRPTSYWAYQITKENLWIAMVGTLGDWYIPEFTTAFREQYPGLLPETLTNPGQALFDAEFGVLYRTILFTLKGKTSETKQCIKILTRIESPWEILRQETMRGKFIWQHFLEIEHSYQSIRRMALKAKSKDNLLLFFYPSTQDAFTSIIANEIVYRNPTKTVIIGRKKSDGVTMSIRSSQIKLPGLITEALDGLHGFGGGHDYACGAGVALDEFDTFLDRFTTLIANAKK